MTAIMMQDYVKTHTKTMLVLGLSIVWVATSFVYFFHSGFFANAIAMADVSEGSISRNPVKNIGPGTNELMDDLKDLHLNPEVVANNSRAFFKVDGKMITLLQGNIKVYEYPTVDALIDDVESFKKDSKTKSGSWKKDVHLYNNEKVIVFYMGEDKEIKAALQSIMGKEVVK